MTWTWLTDDRFLHPFYTHDEAEEQGAEKVREEG
jgi:hypothetical protein